MATATGDDGKGSAGARASALGAGELVGWLEGELGVRVTRIERLPRWRASWLVDAERDGDVLRLYARAERGADYTEPFALEHEHRVHDLLEGNGIPVPHVFGFDAEDRILVMSQLRGVQGLAHASSPGERRGLLLQYVDLLYRTQSISTDALGRAGFSIPEDSRETALSAVFRIIDDEYAATKSRPDPVAEFLRRWVRRNAPAEAVEPCFVAYDAGQFLHHEGKITGLIDFELAHVGHPLMDLAALRLRDTMEPLGELRVAYRRYEELTGRPIEYDQLRYFEVAFGTITPLLFHPLYSDPGPETDLVTYLTWYVDNARYAFDVLAEIHELTLESIDLPRPAPSRSGPSFRHLVRSLAEARGRATASDLRRYGIEADVSRTDPSDDEDTNQFSTYRARCAYRVARHLEQVDAIGDALEKANLEDIGQLTGIHPTSWREGDEVLERLVVAEDPELDVPLIRLLERRMQRLHRLLGPADSLVVRHPPLQPLPDRER